jgi:hypothetical protein
MSRKGTSSGRTDAGGNPGTRQDNSDYRSSHPGPTGPHEPTAHTYSSGAPLLLLVSRDDGWLRIVPERDSSTVYLKWKFTRGQHTGKYVMAVVQQWTLGYGLRLLVEKLEAVDEGHFKPTLDTPYNSR